MSSDQRNLFIALALFLIVYFGLQWAFPSAPKIRSAEPATQSQIAEIPAPADVVAPAPAAAPMGKLIRIETPHLKGTFNTQGARLDNLTLTHYHETIDPSSPAVTLLHPEGQENAYYAQLGWRPAPGSNATLPGPDTIWTADQETLTPETPVTLTWRSPSGLVFKRTISIDENYMFTLVDHIENQSGAPVDLYAYGLVTQIGAPKTEKSSILHEGPLGVFNDKLEEVGYESLLDDKKKEFTTTGGWLGITSKYWCTALIPEQSLSYTMRFVAQGEKETPRFQADYLSAPRHIDAGGQLETTTHLFAGAKSLDLLDAYEKTLTIPMFDRVVDFGVLYFITKPIFYVLDYFHKLLGNFGLSILLLTVCFKAIFFPLASKSYRSMQRMKSLQPKIEALKERFGDDKARMQQETMALYKKEKVNPLSGCLPILVQLPIFFALYKVLYVSLEMRQAPFYGWIHDLSVPDPTTIFNLFGLLPWTPPSLFMIGAWPILMGLTMFLQQKLSPQSADPAQAKIFMLMPIFFTYLFSGFPAGLVIYWTWSNLLSITQQWMIMRKMQPAA